MSTDSVLEEVRAERENQKLSYTEQHDDDEHTVPEWFDLIKKYMIRGMSEIRREVWPSNARFHLVVIAALAVSAIEVIDRTRPPSGSR